MDNEFDMVLIDESNIRTGGLTAIYNIMRDKWLSILTPEAFCIWYILETECQIKEDAYLRNVGIKALGKLACNIKPQKTKKALLYLQSLNLIELDKDNGALNILVSQLDEINFPGDIKNG